eukprot:m.44247 g.44247  ORF g.44247 m.44247 type:complete len:519 (-) comp11688_c0_seq1:31-1587(-)
MALRALLREHVAQLEREAGEGDTAEDNLDLNRDRDDDHGPRLFETREEEVLLERVFESWGSLQQRGAQQQQQLPPSQPDTETLAPTTTAVIPRFFFGHKPWDDDPMQQKLRELAREFHLHRMTTSAVENSELQALWRELNASGTKTRLPADRDGGGGDDSGDDSGDNGASGDAHVKVDYGQFQACGRRMLRLSPKFEPFFKPTVFMAMPRDACGRISVHQFFDFVMRKVQLHQVRLSLCLYDIDGLGWLREKDLENYIFDQIPSLPQLSSLDEHFYWTYVVYATRKFFFFLDPNRTRKIKIQDVLSSKILAEFLELQQAMLPPELEDTNWFSVSSVTRVHGAYISLDTDKNGLLSPKEFAPYGGGGLTPATVGRIFEECTSYSGEIDYKVFLDFVLAKENPTSKQSIEYFFRLLDVQHRGYLNTFAINYFWRSVQEQIQACSSDVEAEDDLAHYKVPLNDIQNEILDMVKPRQPFRITLQDLLASGCGATVCSILTDINGFFAYENRENVAAGDEEHR